ncbi:FtsX-like permease family protein [Mobilicoccus caccae]|uniref:FtsX-like permease family protein n=1 Tax=Mobilicoccus caccae TaxID=1859295 RepID=UPI0024E0422C|nr:FtsX-like permease family protein [Mobilicoccus caccae]
MSFTAPLLVASGVAPADLEIVPSLLPIAGVIAIVVPVALVAALLGTREQLRVAPTDALRQAGIESPRLGRLRLTLAAGCAVAGLLSALTPWVIPGAIGGATAGGSALLLITAAALAGPWLVQQVFDRVAAPLAGRGGASTQLALANTRGFSRRLTSVVVPLALVVTFGIVQNLVAATLGAAGTQQLSDGLRSDVVAASSRVLTPDVLDRVADLPGVRTATPTGTTTAELRSESDDDDPFGARFSWEPVAVRLVPATDATDLIDLGVTAGSLTGLTSPGTVALSSDTAFEHGLSVGDTVPLRFTGTSGPVQEEGSPARVVALYSRGLGLGPVAVGSSTLPAHVPGPSDAMLLIDVEPGATALVQEGVADLGLQVADRNQVIASAGEAEATSQAVSLAVLLVLLAFIALGALNAVAMTTLGRREEFALLQVIGTSRRQVVRSAAMEAGIVGAAAIVLGILAVVPAAAGITYGFAHAAFPSVSWGLVAVLVFTAALVPVAGIPGVATLMTARARTGRLS